MHVLAPVDFQDTDEIEVALMRHFKTSQPASEGVAMDLRSGKT